MINLLLAYDNRPALADDAHAGDLSLRDAWAILKGTGWYVGPFDSTRVSVRNNIIGTLAGSGSGFNPKVREVLLQQ